MTTVKKELKDAAKIATTEGKKRIEDKVQILKKSASKDIDNVVAKAQREFEKVRKQAEVTMKKAEMFMKKNPEKSAAIAAGVGAALATAAAIFLSGNSKKGKKK